VNEVIKLGWKDIAIILLLIINFAACYMIGYYKVNGVMP
jgi:hypothetical protein